MKIITKSCRVQMSWNFFSEFVGVDGDYIENIISHVINYLSISRKFGDM